MAKVYIVKSGEYCKIGYTKSDDVSQRLASMETNSPLNIEVLAEYDADNQEKARRIEAAFHDLFFEYRHKGEWFWYQPIMRYLYSSSEDQAEYVNSFIRRIEAEALDIYGDPIKELKEIDCIVCFPKQWVSAEAEMILERLSKIENGV